MSDQEDIPELPTNVDNLEDLLATLRDAIGAIDAQAHQIGQMRGMFDDEDGTIEDAVDAGEHADTRLHNAVSYVELLIAQRGFNTSVAEDQEAEAQQALAEANTSADQQIQAALAAGVKTPSIIDLLNERDVVLSKLAEEISALANDDQDPTDAEIFLSSSSAEILGSLLLSAAVTVHKLENPEPSEILINCTGGVVQHVLTVEGQNPVLIYLADNDEGEEPGASTNPEYAHLQYEDTQGDEPDFTAGLRRTEGTALPTTGRRWTSLRTEAERIENLDN